MRCSSGWVGCTGDRCSTSPVRLDGSSCRVSMCLCRRKAWCEEGVEEASVAGYSAADVEEASEGRYNPCGH